MKKLLIFVLFMFVLCFTFVDARSNQRPAIKTLEDFFRFESVEQVTSYFGAKNVFTEKTYYGDPNAGGKNYLVSQVNFGTPESALLIWNHKGDHLFEVQTSVFFYDFDLKKIKLIPNNWKTRQGIHAGMTLSQLVKVNWFVLTFLVQPVSLNNGTLLHGFGWLREKRKVSYSKENLIYNYTLDVKRSKNYFPGMTDSILKSNDNAVKKWNPMLEMISVYREGFKPD